jgi:hypothetical protein
MDVGPAVEQQPRHLEVPASGGLDQGCTAVLRGKKVYQGYIATIQL